MGFVEAGRTVQGPMIVSMLAIAVHLSPRIHNVTTLFKKEENAKMEYVEGVNKADHPTHKLSLGL